MKKKCRNTFSLNLILAFKPQKNRSYRLLLLSFAFIFFLGASPLPSTYAADQTTQYRVYQDDRILMEFAQEREAIEFAKGYTNTHVEKISNRLWVWNNYPRYKVYQYDVSLPQWEFHTLKEAQQEAVKWAYSSIRDMQSTGWVWNNYPLYRVYSGEQNEKSKEFPTLDAAQKEAAQWTDAHIIDLSTNAWVWDNLSVLRKSELRANPMPIYQVYQGENTTDDWKFSYLEDAVHEAMKWSNSHITYISNGKVISTNSKRFKVLDQDEQWNEFISLEQSIAYASQEPGRSIFLNGRQIWTNQLYYQVYQGDRKIGEYSSISSAFSYAYYFSNASIRTLEGKTIWDNYRKLQYWGWNGLHEPERIKDQVSDTIGLDVTSPAWFILENADGKLTDRSSMDTVRWLHERGIDVHPLVHNQFDSALTSAFLSNTEAQTQFIHNLVDRASDLGVNGLNIDFESLNAKDRDAYTSFITKLTAYAHSKNLLISIDLPRGSLRWNHLTAFDHAKLANIVDFIMTMAYDQHYKGSPTAGSVSGLDWAEEGIIEFLSYGIPREKLILGIPFYVREWRIDAEGKLVDNRAIFYKDIPKLMEAKDTVSTWDEQFSQYRVEYQEGQYRHVFWLEDEQTVLARIDLAHAYDLAGVAAWRLGYDTPDLWEQMLQKK